MIILGLDPAIRTTGYGVVELTEDGRYRILDCGVIRNTATMPHSECLRRLSGGVGQLVEKFAPECASIEEPFVGRNAGTAIILGMARGAIVAELARRNVPVYAYSPRSAKKAATGYGGASKEQIAALLAAELDIDVAGIALDATDALALAMCHGRLIRFPEMLGKSL